MARNAGSCGIDRKMRYLTIQKDAGIGDAGSTGKQVTGSQQGIEQRQSFSGNKLAAHFVPGKIARFQQYDAETKLRGSNCSRGSGGASPDYGQVENLAHGCAFHKIRPKR